MTCWYGLALLLLVAGILLYPIVWPVKPRIHMGSSLTLDLNNYPQIQYFWIEKFESEIIERIRDQFNLQRQDKEVTLLFQDYGTHNYQGFSYPKFLDLISEYMGLDITAIFMSNIRRQVLMQLTSNPDLRLEQKSVYLELLYPVNQTFLAIKFDKVESKWTSIHFLCRFIPHNSDFIQKMNETMASWRK